MREVVCPVLVFLASNRLRRHIYATKGRDPRSATHWMLPDSNPQFADIVKKRLEQFPNEVTLRRIDGDHHIHMDASATGIIADEMMQWMQRALRWHATLQLTPEQTKPLLPEDIIAFGRSSAIKLLDQPALEVSRAVAPIASKL